jgi:hypothetical protein
VEGIDYGRIHRMRSCRNEACKITSHFSKHCLFKPGAEKIVAALGLRASFPGLVRYEETCQAGVAIGDIVLRCYLSSDDGTIVAEGCAARTVRQDGGPENRDLNKAIKMACKSAYIDASLRASGLSSRLTQDLDEEPLAIPEEPQREAHEREVPDDPIITEKMASNLTALMETHQLNQEKFIAWMDKTFGVTEVSKLTHAQWRRAWEAVERSIKKQEQPSEVAA